MPKPTSKKTSFLNHQLEELELIVNDIADKKYKREQKRLLKRARKKHERGEGQRELRNRIDGD